MRDIPKGPNFSVPFPILKHHLASQILLQGSYATDLYAPP